MSELAHNDETEVAKWGAKYQSMRGAYELFRVKLEALIAELVKDAGVDVIQIESRTKEVDSFTQKLYRKQNKYSDPLDDVTDLVGIRIITYYVEDVARIGEMIEREFVVDVENSVNKSVIVDADRFGYQSMHYIVAVSAARQELVEWRSFADIKFEIQVRTALQHAWAAVNHKLDYKASQEAPIELQRRLFRLSALFELADEQLSQIRDASSRIESEYVEEVRESAFDLPLNSLSLQAYLDEHPVVDASRRLIEEANIPLIQRDDERYSHRAKNGRRGKLLKVLRGLGISGLQELNAFLAQDLIELLKVFNGNTGNAAISSSYLEDIITSLILIFHEAPKEVYVLAFDEKSWPSHKKLVKLFNEHRA